MSEKTNTRKHLLDVANSLLWQHYYSEVGINDICQKAGVTKGGFYHYFPSKADLFCAVVEDQWKGRKRELDELFSPSFEPLEQLENLINSIIRKQEALLAKGELMSCCPFFASAAQIGDMEPKVKEAAVEYSDNVMQYYATLVKRLQLEKMLDGDREPQQTSRILYQFIEGLLTYARIYQRLQVCKDDLREGVYFITGLKQEFQYQTGPVALSGQTSMNF